MIIIFLALFLYLSYNIHIVGGTALKDPRRFYFFAYNVTGGASRGPYFVDTDPTREIYVEPNNIVRLQVSLNYNANNTDPCIDDENHRIEDCISISGDIVNWGLRKGEKAVVIPKKPSPDSTIYWEVNIIFRLPAFKNLKKENYTAILYAYTPEIGLSDILRLNIVTSSVHVDVLPVEQKGFNFYGSFKSKYLKITGRG